jgi:hypothetical protein
LREKKNESLFSVAGVLKSILQVFFGMFVFDRLSINSDTVIGITLSLFAGTMFSYLEYTSKKSKPVTSMNAIDCEQQKPSFDIQENSSNSEKCVHVLLTEKMLHFHEKPKFNMLLQL